MSGVETGLLIGSIVGGTGLNIWGNISAASAQAEAAERQAAMKHAQAGELLARQSINEDILHRQGEELQSQYIASFGSTGKQGGGIGGALRIKKDIDENIMLSRREAEFKASQLRAGADIDTQLGSSLMTSAILGSVGSALTSGAQAYSLFRGPVAPRGTDPRGRVKISDEAFDKILSNSYYGYDSPYGPTQGGLVLGGYVWNK